MNKSLLTQSMKWLRRLSILALTTLTILLSIELVQVRGWEGLVDFLLYGVFGRIMIDLFMIVLLCGLWWKAFTFILKFSRTRKFESIGTHFRSWLPPAFTLSNVVKVVIIGNLISTSVGFFMWNGYNLAIFIGIAIGVGAIYFLLNRLLKKQLEKERLGYEWYKQTK